MSVRVVCEPLSMSTERNSGPLLPIDQAADDRDLNETC
jgi:hypothetical protein